MQLVYFAEKRFFIATKTPRHEDRISNVFFVSLCLGGKYFFPGLPGLGLKGHILKNIPALPKTPTSFIIKKKDLQSQNKKNDILHQ